MLPPGDHCRFCWENCKLRWIDGRATFTIAESAMSRNWTAHSKTSVSTPSRDRSTRRDSVTDRPGSRAAAMRPPPRVRYLTHSPGCCIRCQVRLLTNYLDPLRENQEAAEGRGVGGDGPLGRRGADRRRLSPRIFVLANGHAGEPPGRPAGLHGRERELT